MPINDNPQPRTVDDTGAVIEDPRVQEIIKQAYMPEELSPDAIAPPGVSIKEGLGNDFIKEVKKLLGKEIPEPTPEELAEKAKFLKKVLGPKLAAYVCKFETEEELKQFNKWTTGRVVPQDYERRALINAEEIVRILVRRLKYEGAVNWLTTPCPYLLYELPMDTIQEDPELVRKAALWIFS
jgi:hypothetical protein